MAAALACAGGGAAPAVVPAADPCMVAADASARPLDTVVIAVTDAPLGAPSRWPFAGAAIDAQLETAPAMLDCEGRPRSAGAGAAEAFRVYQRPAASAGEGERAVVLGPLDSTRALRLRFVFWREGADPRDALDGVGARVPRVDVLVTRDPATIAFARSRADFTVRALAWDRTYVLAAPGVSAPDGATAPELARDAVRADARPARPPFWWRDRPACGDSPAPPGPAGARASRGPVSAPPMIAYPAGDRIAQGLAERVVALAARAPDWLGPLGAGPVRAVALPAAEIDAALRGGSARGAVVPWPALAPGGCDDLIGAAAGAAAALIDSRAHVLVRRGAPALLLDGAGTFRALPRAAP